ncbi:MAG: HAMP domain-containing sensor histidine kinase, partial [Polyangiaceae bacterium]
MERERRPVSFVLLPVVLLALGVLTYFTFRTTFQVERLRQQSVLEASLALANEKADRLDRQIVDQDNVLMTIADPAHLLDLNARWLPTAQRETPTVRAILVLDDFGDVLAFASRAGGAWSEEEEFRRLLVERMLPQMEVQQLPPDELRHLHRSFGGDSYLVSYFRREWQGRKYLIVAWHDIGRIVKYALPTLYAEANGGAPSRVNVVDEEGRLIFGPPLRSGEFTVAVRFPTTLYNWRLQVSPAASEELASRVQNRRLLELVMVVLSSCVILAGVATILFAAEKERRMSAMKSEFVANVSHELKTPLALVRMFGEMLQSGRVASPQKQREYLDIIVSESERLSALIENVLDFAKVERGRGAYDFADADVSDAIQRAIAVYKYRAEREGIELVADIEPHLIAHVDERAVQLAVINLIDNAIKYAPDGKIVDIVAAREDGHIAIRVTDRGKGVALEDRERIFERFVRGTHTVGEDGRPVRGSGIGLSLVKHIAESHGGSIRIVESKNIEKIALLATEQAPPSSDSGAPISPSSTPEGSLSTHPDPGARRWTTFLLTLPVLDSPL